MVFSMLSSCTNLISDVFSQGLETLDGVQTREIASHMDGFYPMSQGLLVIGVDLEESVS
jgi:hypothetical protein